jgi:hypothetical protein
MTEIRIPVPKFPRGLASNLAGLLGLLAAVLAIGGLTGNWWWSVLAGGLVLVGLSYVAQTHLAVEVEPAKPRLAAVAKSA